MTARTSQPFVTIAQECPDTPDARSLIAELEAVLNPLYPPASRQGYSVDRLLAENVAFFVLRADGVPAGCGGILLAGTAYGELKRMYVCPPFRGLGYGRLIVDALAAHVAAHRITVLRLETGIHQQEAISLYEAQGFYRIAPFGPYFDDPLSLCYEKRLAQGTAEGATMDAKQPTPQTIDEYIAAFPEAVQAILGNVRVTIRETAPDAVETISYQIPTFKQHGKAVIYFAGYKKHIGIYPVPVGDAALQAEVAPYVVGKGTLQFPLDQPIPLDLVARVVKARVRENLARFTPEG